MSSDGCCRMPYGGTVRTAAARLPPTPSPARCELPGASRSPPHAAPRLPPAPDRKPTNAAGISNRAPAEVPIVRSSTSPAAGFFRSFVRIVRWWVVIRVPHGRFAPVGRSWRRATSGGHEAVPLQVPRRGGLATQLRRKRHVSVAPHRAVGADEYRPRRQPKRPGAAGTARGMAQEVSAPMQDHRNPDCGQGAFRRTIVSSRPRPAQACPPRATGRDES